MMTLVSPSCTSREKPRSTWLAPNALYTPSHLIMRDSRRSGERPVRPRPATASARHASPPRGNLRHLPSPGKLIAWLARESRQAVNSDYSVHCLTPVFHQGRCQRQLYRRERPPVENFVSG